MGYMDQSLMTLMKAPFTSEHTVQRKKTSERDPDQPGHVQRQEDASSRQSQWRERLQNPYRQPSQSFLSAVQAQR